MTYLPDFYGNKVYRYFIANFDGKYYTANLQKHVFWFIWKTVYVCEFETIAECVNECELYVNNERNNQLNNAFPY